MDRRVSVAIGLVFVAFVVGWLMFVSTPRWFSRQQKPVAAAPAPAPPAPPGRKIKARLFYVSEDGTRLTGVEREIAYGEGPLEQAREIISAQIAPVTEPLVSAIPPGTKLRALFMTEGGDAYIDLSREVPRHTGGTLDETLTVYTLVNALPRTCRRSIRAAARRRQGGRYPVGPRRPAPAALEKSCVGTIGADAIRPTFSQPAP
jgi:hypothetical protein